MVQGVKKLIPGKMQYIRLPREEGGHWDWKDKMRVVATYLATGSPALTAKLENVPLPTVHRWRKQEWWIEAINDLQIQEKVESNKTLKKIRDKALEVVADRLNEGNYQYDPKTGKVVRVPIGARDAHRIASDFIDKEDLLAQRLATLNKQQEAKTEDSLQQLAAAFTAMAQGKRLPSNDVVEAEFTMVEESEDAGTS